MQCPPALQRSRARPHLWIEMSEDKIRLDKWLWAARFFKTRSLAAKAISGGKVHLNGRRAKRSSVPQVGDRLRIRKGQYLLEVVVHQLSEHRGPASTARELYEETPESVEARERIARARRAAPSFEFRDKGKPSKKERRQLRRLKGREDL